MPHRRKTPAKDAKQRNTKPLARYVLLYSEPLKNIQVCPGARGKSQKSRKNVCRSGAAVRFYNRSGGNSSPPIVSGTFHRHRGAAIFLSRCAALEPATIPHGSPPFCNPQAPHRAREPVRPALATAPVRIPETPLLKPVPRRPVPRCNERGGAAGTTPPRFRVRNITSIPGGGSSTPVETVQVHHLGPGCHKIRDELRLPLLTRIHLGDRAQLRV